MNSEAPLDSENRKRFQLLAILVFDKTCELLAKEWKSLYSDMCGRSWSTAEAKAVMDFEFAISSDGYGNICSLGKLRSTIAHPFPYTATTGPQEGFQYYFDDSKLMVRQTDGYVCQYPSGNMDLSASQIGTVAFKDLSEWDVMFFNTMFKYSKTMCRDTKLFKPGAKYGALKAALKIIFICCNKKYIHIKEANSLTEEEFNDVTARLRVALLLLHPSPDDITDIDAIIRGTGKYENISTADHRRYELLTAIELFL